MSAVEYVHFYCIGSIPSGIGSMSKLTYVDLGTNSLAGMSMYSRMFIYAILLCIWYVCIRMGNTHVILLNVRVYS